MKAAKHKNQPISGAIVRYTANKHHDIDGFVIDQQGTEMDIKFPPHTARYIRETAAEGDNVQLVLHERHLSIIENSSNHRHFDVESMAPPHPAETGRLIPFSIPKPQYIRGGKEGKHDPITGVLFENKFIHLHPEEYEEGEDLLVAAPVLYVKAKKRVTDAGFVNADGYAVYHAHSINIGEK